MAAMVSAPRHTLTDAAKLTAASFVATGGAFGLFALLVGLIGSLSLAQVAFVTVLTFLISGAAAGVIAAALSAPFVGFSGARQLRSTVNRKFERRRFLKERPGKRRRLLKERPEKRQRLLTGRNSENVEND